MAYELDKPLTRVLEISDLLVKVALVIMGLTWVSVRNNPGAPSIEK